MIMDRPQEHNSERTGVQIDDLPTQVEKEILERIIPQGRRRQSTFLANEILEWFMDIPQERLSQGIGEKTVGVAVPMVMGEVVEVVRLIPQELFQQSSAEETAVLPVQHRRFRNCLLV